MVCGRSKGTSRSNNNDKFTRQTGTPVCFWSLVKMSSPDDIKGYESQTQSVEADDTIKGTRDANMSSQTTTKQSDESRNSVEVDDTIKGTRDGNVESDDNKTKRREVAKVSR